jgi:prevent-host-death family protein
MNKTQVIPSRELRNNYPSVVEMLKNHDRVIVTNRGKGQAVLINFDEYQQYEEYMHYRYVHEALREADEYATSKNAEWYDHEEFWANV